MVDLIFSSVRKLSSSIWSNMADLTEKIDDLICSFDGGGDLTMDTLAMLVFVWFFLGVLILGVTKYVYGRFFAKAPATAETTTTTKKGSATLNNVGEHSKDSDGIKATVKSDASSVHSKMSASKTLGGKSGYVPPTPPLRKRLSTKRGSGPSPKGSRTQIHVNPPQATGPDGESVHWVNEVFAWLYPNLSVVDDLLNIWLQTLNEDMKTSVDESGVGVEIVRVLPETHQPSIGNVFCETSSNNDIIITCDCEATPALQLKAFRPKGEKVEVSHYRMNVNRFRARLNANVIPEKLLGDVKCDGWPDIKVSLAPVGSIKNHADEQALQDLIGDIVVTAMRNSVTPLNLGRYPGCPRFSRCISQPSVVSGQYESLENEILAKASGPASLGEKPGDKRLLVKVIQAKDLGSECRDSYCVVEMDDPPQKYQTSVKKDTTSPVWDEHFLFDLHSGTGELLFEVYERSNKKFLGLGIVGVEELLINPNQRQVISLQPRPYETEDVTGTLTAEFTFIEKGDVNALGNRPYKLKETLRSVTPSGNVITTSKTVFTANENHLANGGEAVTDSALKELELRNKTNPSQASKSTLIIHSVQREQADSTDVRPVIKVQQNENGTWHEVDAGDNATQGISDGPVQNNSQGEMAETSEGEGRGRSRKRRRDFFGTIRRKFKSRTRSKSVDPGERVRGDSLTRSMSADRMRDSSAHSTDICIVPSLRAIDGEMSRRSSVSDVSGLSGASARTYLNEASTLVLETEENGVKRHYLVPLSLAQKSKWRKRGTKLHIYNDHTFVAKHLSGNTICQVCATTIPRRFGKQGYECRDCLLKCHKACHVKADQTCPQSTIQNVELLRNMTSPTLDRKQLPPISPRSKKSLRNRLVPSGLITKQDNSH